ncbi:pregnancy-specific glycoprotein 22-like isoform X2 [Haplochromis burtoni]|uniref:pregnancy-specific glycoprotein 22-like isoform X2 n=1 Tax=Haplochromis burtoni TaxID=8153 RepID=UPI001C2D1858|nr:pregnancy-specific glycoprotein 22-like isoform X2 [Haplochromis burtoni]
MKSMEQFLIIVLLAGGTLALVQVDETTCDLRMNTGPCSPILEGTVYIQVMTNASGREMKCLKVLPSVNITMFNLKKEKIMIDKEFNNRLQFIIKNGTLKITNMRRNDSGQYSIEVFNSDGVQEKNIHFTLDVKDNGKVEALVAVDETTCDLRKNTCPCSPILEGTVYIQVMTDASGSEMKCLKVLPKGNITVFSIKKEKITTDKKFNNRLQFIIKNGTLKITNLKRNDSGRYSVEVFNSNGVQEKNIHFTLDVEDNGNVEALIPGDETTCDLRTNTCPCSPILEGTVYIQVMTDASGHEMKCLKVLPRGNITMFNIKKEKIMIDKEFSNRLTFIIKNGTFKITNVKRNDSGQYSIEVFNSDGVQEKNIHFTLDVKDNGKVEAPVSSVLLVSECLSQGEMRVSCSSEGGDSPQYSWTLDGRTLTDAELLSGSNKTNIITLKQHVSGNLVCSVRNNVSNDFKEERISTCAAHYLMGHRCQGGCISPAIPFVPNQQETLPWPHKLQWVLPGSCLV